MDLLSPPGGWGDGFKEDFVIASIDAREYFDLMSEEAKYQAIRSEERSFLLACKKCRDNLPLATKSLHQVFWGKETKHRCFKWDEVGKGRSESDESSSDDEGEDQDGNSADNGQAAEDDNLVNPQDKDNEVESQHEEDMAVDKSLHSSEKSPPSSPPTTKATSSKKIDLRRPDPTPRRPIDHLMSPMAIRRSPTDEYRLSTLPPDMRNLSLGSPRPTPAPEFERPPQTPLRDPRASRSPSQDPRISPSLSQEPTSPSHQRATSETPARSSHAVQKQRATSSGPTQAPAPRPEAPRRELLPRISQEPDTRRDDRAQKTPSRLTSETPTERYPGHPNAPLSPVTAIDEEDEEDENNAPKPAALSPTSPSQSSGHPGRRAPPGRSEIVTRQHGADQHRTMPSSSNATPVAGTSITISGPRGKTQATVQKTRDQPVRKSRKGASNKEDDMQVD